MFRPHGSKTQDLSQRTSEPIFFRFPQVAALPPKIAKNEPQDAICTRTAARTPPLSARNRPRFSDLRPRFSPASTEMPPVLPRFSLLAQCTRPPVLPGFFLRDSCGSPGSPPVLPRFFPLPPVLPRFSPGSPPVLPRFSPGSCRK